MRRERIIEVEILTNAKTGLLLAISEDLSGLYVHGRTESQLMERIPVAIRSILEAEGKTIGEVRRLHDNRAEPSHAFTSPKRMVSYEAAAMALA